MEPIKVCTKCNTRLRLSEFHKRAASSDGHEARCKDCKNADVSFRDEVKRDKSAELDTKVIAEAEARARRFASDTDALRLEDLDDDYDVGVGNVDTKEARKASSKASKEKRQEFNAEMGNHANELKHAAATAHERGGDIASAMSGRAGAYIGKLAEQEKRFQNRRLARTVSLAQAGEAMSLQLYKQIAREFFADKITAVGFAKKKPTAPKKRSAVLLLSDLHLGAELSSLDEPMPFRAIEEARRLEYILRETCDYKPRYRADTELVLCLNGDLIEGQLMHQIGAGAPLAEQKAIFWTYFRRMLAEFSAAFPSVRVFCQPGNHGRDKVRHPGRATWRKWDGHEFEMMWALKEMCSGLHNVTFDLPFRAVTAIDLHGSTIGMSHGDTEIKLSHPDGGAKNNARALDRVNATLVHGHTFDGWLFGHFHSGRVMYTDIPIVWNGALVPPNGHARAEGYIGEAMGQFLFEAVEGHPIGDVRFLKVGPMQDRDEKLGMIIKPFRFPNFAE